MNYGYVKAVEEQSEARQSDCLRKYNINMWIYDTSVNQKSTIADWFIPMLNPGDTVYIADFSKLAENTRELIELVELLQEKNINLVSDKEQFDTSTSGGKLAMTMISAVNEFEREMELERQKELKMLKPNDIQKPRKMTLAEIEKQLGFPVEIVS